MCKYIRHLSDLYTIYNLIKQSSISVTALKTLDHQQSAINN